MTSLASNSVDTILRESVSPPLVEETNCGFFWPLRRTYSSSSVTTSPTTLPIQNKTVAHQPTSPSKKLKRPPSQDKVIKQQRMIETMMIRNTSTTDGVGETIKAVESTGDSRHRFTASDDICIEGIYGNDQAHGGTSSVFDLSSSLSISMDEFQKKNGRQNSPMISASAKSPPTVLTVSTKKKTTSQSNLKSLSSLYSHSTEFFFATPSKSSFYHQHDIDAFYRSSSQSVGDKGGNATPAITSLTMLLTKACRENDVNLLNSYVNDPVHSPDIEINACNEVQFFYFMSPTLLLNPLSSTFIRLVACC